MHVICIFICIFILWPGRWYSQVRFPAIQVVCCLQSRPASTVDSVLQSDAVQNLLCWLACFGHNGPPSPKFQIFPNQLRQMADRGCRSIYKESLALPTTSWCIGVLYTVPSTTWCITSFGSTQYLPSVGVWKYTVGAIYIGAVKSIGAALFTAILGHLKKTFSTFYFRIIFFRLLRIRVFFF